jgi:hypothetical protein
MPEIESAEKRQGLHLACFTRTVVESKRNSLAPTVKTAFKCESRVSGDLQASQQCHLLSTVTERGVLSHQSLHAPHAGRELGVLDIQLLVGGELALMAMRAQIPGPRDFHRAQSGQHAPRAQFAVTRLVTARTRKAALWFGWLAEAQQLAERGGAGMMQRSAEGHLHRFQIRLAGLLALGEDASQ